MAYNTFLFDTLLLLLWCVCVFSCVLGYNIEVGKVGIARGEAGTQFGYTVAIIKAPGWVDNNNPKQPKVLLAGAPNRTVTKGSDVIKGHGDLVKCDNPNAENITCNWMDIREETDWGGDQPGLCAKLIKDDRFHCEEDSRMGASLAVNRKYESTMDSSDHIPMVSVCAPGWKNVYPSTQNYMIGMCLKLRDELSVLSCDAGYSNRYTYCWPFWPVGNAFKGGRPYFAYSQAGMSAAFTSDGKSELLGAPGANDWKGGYSAVQKQWTKLGGDQQSTTYYGYAIASGRFKVRDANTVAGDPNHYATSYGHFGKVEFLNENRKVATVDYGVPIFCSSMKTYSQTDLDHLQVGTKFGAAVAAIDLTNDGYDELLVGAPLFSGDGSEEGRVYVYTTIQNQPCGPIGVLSGGAKYAGLKSKTRYARFGTSITSAGDLNNDGYKDVAIGAPYEDDGKGVVYIYHGLGQCDCLMEDKFAQRIAGRDIIPSIQSFGWSLYGDDDIDYNGYPDLAVGAYTSDMAVVLRTRPIVKMTVSMTIEPSPIPLNASTLDCSLDKDQLCMVVYVFITAYTAYPPNSDNILTVNLAMDLDTVYTEKGEQSRVQFRDTLSSRRNEHINITDIDSSNRVASKQYILDVVKYNGKPEPKDAWTKIRLEGTLDLVRTAGDDFDKLDPVLDKDAQIHVTAEADFDKNCPSLVVCTSDLKLGVDLFLTGQGAGQQQPSLITNNTVIYIDPTQELLQMDVDVRNILNSSYRANFTSHVQAATRSTLQTTLGKIKSSCNIKQERDDSSTNMTCSADSKLDMNENFKVRAYYDISQARLVPGKDLSRMQTSINIVVRAGQANIDVDSANDVYRHTLSVKLQYSVHILEDKEESDQVLYKADPQSTRMITLVHRYFITNKGPSFLPKTYVNITVPVKKGLLKIARIQTESLAQYCQIRGKEAQIGTTSTTTTERPTTIQIDTPDLSRKRRNSPENQPQVGSSANANDDTSKSRNITCSDTECEVIECQINGLGKDEQLTIDVKLEVYENAIANEKDVREVRYETTATVTDPYIWFGGKVVPWDKTPYAEKWTKLVVEPASVVSEIDIWIIIGSVLGAVALLVIVIIILWKLGFFKRKKHTEVKKWKRDSLYNKRKSGMRASMSGKTDQPYSAMEKSGDEPS